jgi:hypothetical protein
MFSAALLLYGTQAAGAVDAAWRAVNVSGGNGPLPTPEPTPTPSRCGGDCNQDGLVTIDEVITIVRAILADIPDTSTCPTADANQDGLIFISDAVAAVFNALTGCGAQGDIASVSTAGTVSAARDATIEVGSAFARPGDTVMVDLRLRDAPADIVAPGRSAASGIIMPCRSPEGSDSK